MSYLLVHHKVKDFDKWKPFFDDHTSFRGSNGSKGGTVYRDPNKPNNVTILFEWDNDDDAKKFAKSKELKDVMKRAGVVSKPDVHILEKIEKFSK